MLVRVHTVFWTETVLDGLKEEDDGVICASRVSLNWWAVVRGRVWVEVDNAYRRRCGYRYVH